MNPARSDRLQPGERAKLTAILGRLGSEHDGERAAAGLLAVELLRKRGLTWDDILGDPPAQMPPPADWQKRVAWCAARPALLTPWERAFLEDMGQRRNPPTQKQTVVIERLVERRLAAGGGR